MSKTADWENHKFREFFIKGLVTMNGHMEFGLLTTTNARIVRDRFQSVFRPWSQDTPALLCAHLDRAGPSGIGDSERGIVPYVGN
jgi:hypothetical protein